MDLSRFWHKTNIYNIVYLEITLNWPKEDHLMLSVISQVHRTRNFMDQSSVHWVKEKRQQCWGGEDRQLHSSCHTDTEPHSDNRTWCDRQNTALLDCVHIGINRVIAIRAMQRSAAGNINKQPFTCNLYFSFQNSWYTAVQLCIYNINTLCIPICLHGPWFSSETCLCVCVFYYWLKIFILSCFRSANFVLNPLKRTKIFSCLQMLLLIYFLY